MRTKEEIEEAYGIIHATLKGVDETTRTRIGKTTKIARAITESLGYHGALEWVMELKTHNAESFEKNLAAMRCASLTRTTE